MRRILLSVVFSLLCSPLVFGQAVVLPPPRITPVPVEPTPMQGTEQFVSFDAPSRGPQQWSLTAEYLLWWTSRSPVSVPLVTTGDPTRANAGFIGDQSTRVLFGNSYIDYGSFSGGRLGLSRWLDESRFLGIEGSAFLFGRQDSTFFAGSNNTAGSPLLVFPYQTPASVETGLVISSPNSNTQGNVRINTGNRFWGGDVNGVMSLWQNSCTSVDGLLGFRYFDLGDSLEFVSNSVNPRTNVNYSAIETFRTRNQFYGAQLGTRVGVQRGRWSADFAGFVALGSTEQNVSAVGTSNFSGTSANPVGTNSGFLYTQRTNIGNRHYSNFSAIPQFQLKTGFDITSRLRATVGYDAIWWNSVVRPGDQIDHTVNITQASTNITGGQGALNGAARPSPRNATSDFWAHGVSFGLEFRW